MNNPTHFSRLIGKWTTSGSLLNGDEVLTISGTDRYEWILGAHYLLHTANVLLGNQHSETMEVIKPGNSAEHAVLYFFNANGADGMMNGTIQNDTFKIEGSDLRFEGTFSQQDTILQGKWYRRNEADEWTAFIQLQLLKQSDHEV
jgi:hypothetical protein